MDFFGLSCLTKIVVILFLQYFEKVAERIKDTGVSVRKRAIKIIRDLCISNPAFPEASNAFIEIISRVSDEESSIQVNLLVKKPVLMQEIF